MHNNGGIQLGTESNCEYSPTSVVRNATHVRFRKRAMWSSRAASADLTVGADIVVESNMIGPGSSGIVVGRSAMPAKKNLTDSARGIYLRNNQCDETGPACPDSNYTTSARST